MFWLVSSYHMCFVLTNMRWRRYSGGWRARYADGDEDGSWERATQMSKSTRGNFRRRSPPLFLSPPTSQQSQHPPTRTDIVTKLSTANCLWPPFSVSRLYLFECIGRSKEPRITIRAMKLLKDIGDMYSVAQKNSLTMGISLIRFHEPACSTCSFSVVRRCARMAV